MLSVALTELLAAIRDRGPTRLIVAIAGAPGSGKSTLAEAAASALNAKVPGSAVVVPMDGYHLDDAILTARGLRAVKGAPHTFDAGGLGRDLAAIRAARETVYVPVFDRSAEVSRAGARVVEPDAAVVLVEGNYLLLDEVPWRGLASLFDLTVMLSVSEPELERRLVARWQTYGHDASAALARARGNDMANARTVMDRSRPADLVLSGMPQGPHSQGVSR